MQSNLLLKMISSPKISYEQIRSRIHFNPGEVRETDRNKLTPLHRAVERENITIVNILIVWGADPNARDEFGFTPLHYAVGMKNYDMVRLLLENNAVVDAKSNSQRTPLHILSMIDQDEKTCQIANLLLDYLAYPSYRDDAGFSPLDYALRNNNIELYNILNS
jgi:ankyrin repeat protein